MGMPRNAMPAFAAMTSLFIMEPMVSAMNVLVFLNDTDDYWNVMFYFIFGGPILVLVPMVIASNSGDIRVIKLIRPAAYLAQALWAFNTGIAILALCVLDFDQSGLCTMVILGQLVLLYPIWMMRQSIKVCRWLDPNSRPDEWEIAARNDPDDRAYRGPKSNAASQQIPPADHL
jgi:hypothetical protein